MDRAPFWVWVALSAAVLWGLTLPAKSQWLLIAGYVAGRLVGDYSRWTLLPQRERTEGART